jgi:hypothetical protein
MDTISSSGAATKLKFEANKAKSRRSMHLSMWGGLDRGLTKKSSLPVTMVFWHHAPRKRRVSPDLPQAYESQATATSMAQPSHDPGKRKKGGKNRLAWEPRSLAKNAVEMPKHRRTKKHRREHQSTT